ncbi:hypothetical protein BH11ARM1_BH11ARM1_02000 [soil metagenome]
MDKEFETGLAIALKKMRNAECFESEIRGLLAAYPASTVDQVIGHLQQKSLLNDLRAAESVVRYRSGKRLISNRALTVQLTERGASQETIEKVLGSAEDEMVQLGELLASRYQPSDHPGKAGRFLYTRGFSDDQIETALESYFGVIV